jgi:hypothetical protein
MHLLQFLVLQLLWLLSSLHTSPWQGLFPPPSPTPPPPLTLSSSSLGPEPPSAPCSDDQGQGSSAVHTRATAPRHMGVV